MIHISSQTPTSEPNMMLIQTKLCISVFKVPNKTCTSSLNITFDTINAVPESHLLHVSACCYAEIHLVTQSFYQANPSQWFLVPYKQD